MKELLAVATNVGCEFRDRGSIPSAGRQITDADFEQFG